MSLKEDDIIVCKVKKIEGTMVFLDIEGNGEGTMVMSEVAAGRIRNLREYVFPNKIVVCKVLKIGQDGHPQLSLRRVTGKEREKMQDNYKKEKTFASILKSISPDFEKIIESIKKAQDLPEFIDELKSSPSLLEKYLDKEQLSRLHKMLTEKEGKEKISKKEITLKSFSSSGIKDIRDILSVKGADIHYLGSSRFSISAKGSDFKEANTLLNSMIEKIEKASKEKKAILEIKEK